MDISTYRGLTELVRSSKLKKTNSWASSITADQLFNSTSNYPNNDFSVMKAKLVIDFSSVSMNYPRDVIVSPGSVNTCRGTKRDRSSSPKVANAQAQDHLMAERRREKLNKKFIALSGLVPGLKRNHQLQGEEFSNAEAITEPLPEIGVRFSRKDLLIRIHCVRRKSIQDKVVAEVGKFPLFVINSMKNSLMQNS